MEIENLSLPATNRFATEYLEQTKNIQRYFHYRYNDQLDFEKRRGELMNRSFMREELAAHIEQYMSKFPGSDMVQSSLQKLKQENSTVIIGGQQAGILTGPLYSIHKIISIVSLAKQKERELNAPVIPVFWIAGEDHDFQEVNHVYVENNYKIEKKVYPEKIRDKRMVSDITIDRDQCLKWAEAIIQTFGETEHTLGLLAEVETAISKSDSFVDFFAHLIMQMFKDTGLLIIDSGDRKLRSLEKEFFVKQINSFKDITKSVLSQQSELKEDGFSNMIEISNAAANLFYYDEDHYERILLEYDEDKDAFSGKDGSFQITRQSLLDLAQEFPEKLSNNVVTRPIMQEWLFPTLAFIAGPGEIAYWAELKLAFEHFDLRMPPIVPRLNITFLDRSIESDILELGLDLEEVLISGTEKERLQFLQSIRDQQVKELFNKTKQEFLQNYEMLESYLMKKDTGLVPLLKKNEGFLIKQLDFMEAKLDQAEQLKYDVLLNKFARVENAIRPLGSPQERMLNCLFFINQYGFNIIHNLLECSFTFDGTHKLIKM
ncbi:bacillithiol biosynthesis cysteine-adding enzyme BshC [Bacillus sp. DTU_2020_1000418_1_SI_GHA_SEK_038]|uniref:bacillithiol biosynthesis cysteine-adding enzyme BshC n=1 Tax=Bacillus sp. DTU_2020_1000418_1_SI_GHA_SEK_038 TaxID=3077585 RepID=UPI0028F00CA0|nr:bacillithiol biosynthesis cysteine-adding enzyme BshC [Bacillus sp. DTU_2020_1000418_1_SI_GHA_SEK_038]WNS77072.1 bacillithiol biosynthesis cysteine-adding enzyme BshC [Bacillus sp. DTU_2020_1000418_1_SI_GHA_SEK_038]